MSKIIEHNLLPNQKSRKNKQNVKVELYDLSAELYDEFFALGIIKRLKDIPQLGVIKVSKKLEKSRFDYTVLQLYFHQLVRKKLQSQLELTYNNSVKAKEFRDDLSYPSSKNNPTVADLLQILAIAYNIGHFFNTFTASRSVIMLAENNSIFRNKFIKSSNNERFHKAAEIVLKKQNYQRLHILNSLLVLERCNQEKQSVFFAQELLYAYLNEDSLDKNSKLHFIFNIFRSIRNVSYISYDLQIAKMPFIIDLYEEDAVLLLFRELLSIYNNQLPANDLIKSIGKMLDDTVYNENSNAICYYQISRKIVRHLVKNSNFNSQDYYSDLWLSPQSFFNRKYGQSRDYAPDSILKLTFSAGEKHFSNQLLKELERINYLRAGYYDRHSGEQTILISIKKKCPQKTKVAFRVLKTTIKCLRKIPLNRNEDKRYLLATKFFIYHLFGEKQIVIKPTVDTEVCVLCTRGKKSRILEIESLLSKGNGKIDERHEVEFIYNYLIKDNNNDTSITVPASVLIHKDSTGKKLCEFDGMVIYPMRKSDQIILLEAKNTELRPLYAKNCLLKKLKLLHYEFNEDSIETFGHDALIKLTI